MPILCNYYLTYRCNAYCDFCHFGNHTQFKNAKHARTQDVLRNLPHLKRIGVRFIDFTGGEPLLHPDIAEITKSARKVGFRTSITTNGLLYPKFAKALRGSVDLLHFSLDSSIPEEHNASRGVDCFSAVTESVRIARELGEQPDIIFTVTNDTIDRMEGVYELTRSWGLVLLLNPIFGYFREEGLRSDILNEVEQFAKRPMTYLNPSFITLRRQGGNNPAKPLCKAVSRVVVISPGNEILLPCYHLGYEKIPIGENLTSARKSPRIAWHTEHEGRHIFCAGCTINCYFEPSFAFPVNALSVATIPSKVRYGYNKFVQRFFSQ